MGSLASLARRVNRQKPSRGGERITENTLIRVAVDWLLSQKEYVGGSTEEEIRRGLGVPSPVPEGARSESACGQRVGATFLRTPSRRPDSFVTDVWPDKERERSRFLRWRRSRPDESGVSTVLGGSDHRKTGGPLSRRRRGCRYTGVPIARHGGLVLRYHRTNALAFAQHQREPGGLFLGHVVRSLPLSSLSIMAPLGGLDRKDFRAAGRAVEHPIWEATHLRVAALAGVTTEDVRQLRYLPEGFEEVVAEKSPARGAARRAMPTLLELADLAEGTA